MLQRSVRPSALLVVAAECLAGAFIAAGRWEQVLAQLPRISALVSSSVALFAAFAAFEICFPDPDENSNEALPATVAALPGMRDLAWRWALTLLGLGVLLTFIVGQWSTITVIGLALVGGMHVSTTRFVWGARYFTHGLCRAINFALGLSLIPDGLTLYWQGALAILAYVVGVALILDNLRDRRLLFGVFLGLVHVAGTFSGLLYLAQTQSTVQIGSAWPLLAAFFLVVFPPLLRAALNPRPAEIARARHWGALGSILLAATLCGWYAGLYLGLVVAALVIPAHRLARRFPPI